MLFTPLCAPTEEKNPVGERPRLATWLRHRKRSLLRQMVTGIPPDVLSFAGGLPAPELFPSKDFSFALEETLRDDTKSLQYDSEYGDLKAQIVALMARRGVRCHSDNVVLTAGAQQGLSVLSHLLLDPGKTVLLEKVTYTGIQQAIAFSDPQVRELPTSLHDGIKLPELTRLLSALQDPAFLYLVPDFANPTGSSIPLVRRRELVELARLHRLPIIEDDPYGFLAYDGQAPPPLRACDEEWIFYVGSFSKIIAPALRLGWMVLPRELAKKASIIKEAADLECSALLQRATSRFLARLDLSDHLDRLRKVYGERRDAMLEALDRYLPAGVSFSRPAGGMFVWLELAKGLNSQALLARAIDEQGIAFVPGTAFTNSGHGAENCLRLSFSQATPNQIEDGIRRLAKLF